MTMKTIISTRETAAGSSANNDNKKNSITISHCVDRRQQSSFQNIENPGLRLLDKCNLCRPITLREIYCVNKRDFFCLFGPGTRVRVPDAASIGGSVQGGADHDASRLFEVERHAEPVVADGNRGADGAVGRCPCRHGVG